MSPSVHQEPPHDLGASAIGRGAPPDTGARHILPAVKKATNRLSGEKNGSCAAVLCSTAWAAAASIDLMYRREVSKVRPAAYAIVRPSREMAGTVVTCSPAAKA